MQPKPSLTAREYIDLFNLESCQDERVLTLLARIQELEDVIGVNEPTPGCLGLSTTRRRILAIILKRPEVSADQLLDTIYSPAFMQRETVHEMRALYKHINKIKNRLADFGVALRRVSRAPSVYAISSDDKGKLRTLIASHDRNSR